VGNRPNLITCAKFQNKIFRCYDFTGGGGRSNFPLFLLTIAQALQQYTCSATTLPVIKTWLFCLMSKLVLVVLHNGWAILPEFKTTLSGVSSTRTVRADAVKTNEWAKLEVSSNYLFVYKVDLHNFQKWISKSLF